MEVEFKDPSTGAAIKQTPGAGEKSGMADLESAGRATRLPAVIKWLLPVIFFLLLWLPLMDSAFHLDHTAVTIENRILAVFPHWTGWKLENIKSYLAGIETYFNDHFGFRRGFIRAHSVVKRKLFREGSTDVLIGADSWLYFKGDRAIDNHLGLHPLPLEKIQAWQQLLEKREAWLAQKGIKHLFVIPPNKETIYPEHLPGWANKPGARTEIDDFLDYMNAHSSVKILDLRPALREAKKKWPTYLLTDTHWNAYGAYAGYSAIIETLSRQLPGLKPVPFESFEVVTNIVKGGDLSTMLAQEETLKETNYYVFKPHSPLKIAPTVSAPELFPKKWAAYNEPKYIENPRQKLKAVIFRDSFTEALQPYLGFNFQRVVMIWQFQWNRDLIEREKPDVVIDEVLERYLGWDVPKE